MKKSFLLIAIALLLIPSSALAAPVGPGTSFQFRLTDGGQLYTGSCNVQLKLYDALTSGMLLGTSTHTSVSVANGEASVYPTWGDQWEGSQRWIEVAVQCGADVGYTTLSPRLEITATPYASYSLETPYSGITGKPAACAAGYALVDFSGTCAQLTTGTASANQVAYWSGAYALAGEAGLTYDAATDTLTSGNLTLSGSSRRIVADFDNNTAQAYRAGFQTSTTNAGTFPSVIPNGTSNAAGISFYNNSDPDNAVRFVPQISASDARLVVNKSGTGSSTYPLAFVMYGSEKMRLQSTGEVGINTTGPDRRLDVLEASAPQLRLSQADGSVYAEAQMQSNGVLSITVTGGSGSQHGVSVGYGGNGHLIFDYTGLTTTAITVTNGIDAGAYLTTICGDDNVTQEGDVGHSANVWIARGAAATICATNAANVTAGINSAGVLTMSKSASTAWTFYVISEILWR